MNNYKLIPNTIKKGLRIKKYTLFNSKVSESVTFSLNVWKVSNES